MDKRNVTTKGIRFNTNMYWNDELKKYMGEQIHVLESDINSIDVYKGRTFICKASRVMGTSKKENDKGGHGKDMLGFGKKLEDYKTKELIKELQSRQNVTIARMNEGQQYKFRGDNKHVKEWGPATVLIIRNA